jgi:hypothetical protein
VYFKTAELTVISTITKKVQEVDPNDIEMSPTGEICKSPALEDLDMLADQIFEI